MSTNEITRETNLKISLLENNSVDSQDAIDNIRYALRYAKIPFEEVDKEDLNSLEPDPFHVLVVAGEHTSEWPYESIEAFVNKGGRLMVALRHGGSDPKWNDLTGIEETNDFVSDTVHGLTIEKPVFPGYNDLSGEHKLLSHSVLDVELSKSAVVYLTVKHIPVMWTYPHGKGKVGFWNTTVTKEKGMRGLLLQSLSLLPPSFVMHQSGIKVTYLDDFPSPIKDEFVHGEGMGYGAFLKDVWWDRIKKLQKDYNLSLTGAFIGTYQDKTDLNTEELIKRQKYPMLYYGRQLENSGGEIALHGYNHQPLVVKEDNHPLYRKKEFNPYLLSVEVGPTHFYNPYGYKIWKSESFIKRTLKDTNQLFQYYFPKEKIQTYVPPSNILGKRGLDALLESIPSLNVLASLYFGEKEDESFIQEYEFDHKYSDLYHFPRTASGHGDSPEDLFLITDAIANQGVFSHFIHPDDRTDPERAQGRNWEEMSEGLEGMYQFISKNFPYLESLTQQEAREKMITYQQSKIDVRYQEDSITISGEDMLDPSVALVRIQPGKHLETGEFSFGEVEVMQASSGLYIVTLRKPSVTLLLKEDVS
nr:DUF2194 domain-containing protein [Pontibacillus sp. HN14]